MSHLSLNQNNFKDHYNNKNEVYGISKTRMEKILQLFGDAKNRKILDVGCGEGHLGKIFVDNGHNVYGVDISDKSIEIAKKVLYEAVCVDMQKENLPYKDDFFDVIILGEVVEHLLLPEKILLEIKRVLKNNGFIIITTPNFLVFSNRIKILMGKFEYTESGFLDRGHIHFFHIDSFKKMIESLGLKVDAFNNVYYGRVPEFIARIWPKSFTYQIVAKVSKKQLC